MPLNSVQLYVKGLLDGLANPQLPDLIAVISDPVMADAAMDPFAYVWGATGHKERQTAPRPVAWQKWLWDIEVSVVNVREIDSPDLDTAFPLLLDQIDAKLSTTPMTVKITDPITNFDSQILAVGEHTDLKYSRLKTTGVDSQGIIQFGCDFTCRIEEAVSYYKGSPYNP
jgi:hypothetical protein